MKKTSLFLAHLLACHAWLWAALGLLTALAFGPPPARAAVTEAWVHRYSNSNVVSHNSDDQAIKVVRDATGDIIVTGTTDDGIDGPYTLTIKYSGADGAVLWKKRSNGGGQAMAVDASDNVVVTGYFTAKYASADGALLWERPYTNNGGASAVAVDGTGNVLVTGYSGNSKGSADYYTAKYASADGTLLWERLYDGPANGYDYATAVALDGSGDVVVTGYSNNGPPNYDNDYYTAKYSTVNGALLWEKRYNGPTNSDDQALAVAVDGSGNVTVTGTSQGDYYTAKYAARNGALLWEKRYNGPANGNDAAQAVAMDGSGNVVVTGYSFSGRRSDNDYDYYTAKYAAADGALLWERRYDGPGNDHDYATALAVDSSGNVVVSGTSIGSGSSWDYYTAKYASADGALLWEKRYNGPANSDDQARAVAVDGTGNVVVTGYSNNGGAYYDNDYYTAKYASADGAVLWEKRYNGPAKGGDFAKAVAVDGNGNVVVTGVSDSRIRGFGGLGGGDYYTAKYAVADGALLWEQRYTNGAASALAVDSSGNVVVTGTSDYDYYTAKYAAADGALLWEQRYIYEVRPWNFPDFAKAVAVDGSGDVVVTGVSHVLRGNYVFVRGDYYTAKYAAADGALLWEKRYGAAYAYDVANAVAVDVSGNVVVTGMTDGDECGDGSYYTAKYAAADGALLWEQRYYYGEALAVAVDRSNNVVVTGHLATIKYLADGTGVWTNGGGTALAVDGAGNVVVTGDSYNETISDNRTAKYAGADGALLWEQRYGSGQAVVVDGSGNVVVTGYSDNSAPNLDYYTAKYAAADGALLWEKRYNGPANGDDTASSLALGPNGMVAVTGSSSGDYATVVYRDDVYPVSIAVGPGGVRLCFTGIPGRSYRLQRAPSVTGPWSTSAPQTAPASGLVELLDVFPPPGQSFYRTVQP